MCGTCTQIFDNYDVASRPCPHEDASVSNRAQPGRLEWTTAAVKLLINSCQQHRVSESTSSKREGKARWDRVVDEFAQHGYPGLSWDTLRKKWYRLLETYRKKKDKANKSGAGAVQWEWFQALDQVLGKDPNITPVSTVSTTPRSLDPIQVTFPEASGSAATSATPACTPATTPCNQQLPLLDSPVSSQPVKRKRPSAERGQTLKDLLMEEKENRKKYREEKLMISREKLAVLKSIQVSLSKNVHR